MAVPLLPMMSMPRGQASTLKVNNTFMHYYEKRVEQMNNLCIFGDSAIGNEVFNSSSSIKCFLASRCVLGDANNTNFSLQTVKPGFLSDVGYFCYSGGGYGRSTYPFRIVVSVPASHINVADDGTVSLK